MEYNEIIKEVFPIILLILAVIHTIIFSITENTKYGIFAVLMVCIVVLLKVINHA